MNKLNPSSLYSNSIRNITVIFGSIFSNLSVYKYNKDGSLSTKTKKVPLFYTEKQAYAYYLEQGTRLPNGNLEIAQNFPRMSFEMASLQMEPSRGINTNLFRNSPVIDANGTVNKQQSPISYRFGFNLTVWANNMNDSIQLLDQILPVFSPELSIKTEETAKMNIVNDVQICFNGISKDDNYQNGLEENRLISWTLDFDVYANIIHSVEKTSVIKEVFVTLIDDTTRDYLGGKDPEFLSSK